MHKIAIPSYAVERAHSRRNRLNPFENIEPARTALVVVDLQNGFMAPGQPAEIAQAREIVPNVNRLAAVTRAAGGTVVWIQNTITPESEKAWSVYLGSFADEEWGSRMRRAFTPGDFGHALLRAAGSQAERPDRAQIPLQRARAERLRSRRDLTRPRHRYDYHRRHRDEHLLRIDRAGRDDAELQGVLRVGRERVPYGRGA